MPKKIVRKIVYIIFDLLNKIKEFCMKSRVYIRIKENLMYYKFSRDISHKNLLLENAEYDVNSIYRTTFINDRNRELVELCKKKDTVGIQEWYKNMDSNLKYFDEYYSNRMSMRMIARHIADNYSSARILDIACGHGEIDLQLKEHGFDVYACDLNPNRVAVLQNRLNNIQCASFEEYTLWGGAKFDVVLALEVLEHIMDIDIALNKIFGFLSEKGRVYLSVPNEFMIEDEQHVRLFSSKSIRYLLEKHSFKILTCCTLPYLNTENNNDLVCVCEKE